MIGQCTWLFVFSFSLCIHRFIRVRLFATLWTITCQALPSMGFSRQEYWNGLPFPLLGDLPYPGIKPVSLISPASAGRFFATSSCLVILKVWSPTSSNNTT